MISRIDFLRARLDLHMKIQGPKGCVQRATEQLQPISLTWSGSTQTKPLLICLSACTVHPRKDTGHTTQASSLSGQHPSAVCHSLACSALRGLIRVTGRLRSSHMKGALAEQLSVCLSICSVEKG